MTGRDTRKTDGARMVAEAYAHHQAGHRAEAEALCRSVLERQPSHPGALNVLAVMAQSQGRLRPALKLAEMAVTAAPAVPDYRNTLGTVLADLRRWEECFAAFAEAVRLDPNYYDGHRNLAVALSKANRLDEAAASLERAAELRPDLPQPLDLLVSLHHQRLDLPAVISCLRRRLARQPNDAALHSSLLYTLHYDSAYSPEQLFAEHLEWARRHEAPLLDERDAAGEPHFSNDPDPGRRLRIGYVSAGFHDHPIARFQEPILAHHDRSRFEVFCYADEPKPDAVTQRLRGLCDQWADVAGQPDEAVAERVRRDRIDVLVDLSGHDSGNRLLAFARRPAPVLVTCTGYIDTTGMSSMGWRLTDALHAPPGGTERFHTEKLLRLPGGNWCYRGDTDAPDPAPPPSLSPGPGGVTFGSLNKLVKVSPQAANLWGRVLSAVPGSRLLLSAAGGEGNRCARDRLVSWGIPSERLELLPQARERREYLERFSRIDVCLDPFPFNGITTTCDALWMGVPVVSLAGKTHVSRSGVSLLSAVALHDLVAQTPDDYVRVAASLAADRPRLAALRSGLRQKMLASPLCDGRRAARETEEAYRHMWRAWCAARAAAGGR